MARTLQMLSVPLDVDALAMADARRDGGADRHPNRVDAGWVTRLRAALQLRRAAPVNDRLATFGEPALRAAALAGWRGPIDHVRGWFEPPVPPALRKRLGSRLKILQSPSIERLEPGASDVGATPAAAERAALRERFGFAPTDRLIFAPGTARHESGHRLALWAVSILHFRDPRYRLVVSARGDIAPLRRFAREVASPALLREVARATDRELATACDAALALPTDDRFERLPLCAVRNAGVPLYASPSVATATGIRASVKQVQAMQARLIARDLLDHLEPRPSDDPPLATSGVPAAQGT